MNFELRIEAQNAFNHPVFGTPNTTVDDPSFGQIGIHVGGRATGAVGDQVQLLRALHKTRGVQNDVGNIRLSLYYEGGARLSAMPSE